jgi:hypothetical protein
MSERSGLARCVDGGWGSCNMWRIVGATPAALIAGGLRRIGRYVRVSAHRGANQ